MTLRPLKLLLVDETSRLCDGRIWTGEDPEAYAQGFALPA
jgi:hypothetical protein